LDGKSVGIKRITEVLNSEGNRYRGGKRWTKQRIQERLSDPLHIGEHYFNKKDSRTRKLKNRDEWILIPVEPIVDRDTYEEAKSNPQDAAVGGLVRNVAHRFADMQQVWCENEHGEREGRCVPSLQLLKLPAKRTLRL